MELTIEHGGALTTRKGRGCLHIRTGNSKGIKKMKNFILCALYDVVLSSSGPGERQDSDV